MIKQKVSKQKCTGCYACYNACPYECITMVEDNEGFYYPNVDNNKCKNCNICVNVCPVLKQHNRNNYKEIVAAYSTDEKNRMTSSSGGCFGEFAKHIIKNNGVVFGVGYDDNLNVIHKYITKLENLKELQGSKYVQSKINKMYNVTKKHLEEKKLVLFSGTPCQIAGLKSFLGKEYENLYTIDVVCHGVPSQKTFDIYLKKYKGKVKEFNFRDKTYGWRNYNIRIKMNNGEEKVKPARDDFFMKGFLSNVYLRESCYNCDFKESYADISIGDFWGIDKIKPEFNDDKGMSILLINTNKGKRLLNECEKNLVIISNLKKEDLVKYNPCIEKSVKRPKGREIFFYEIEKTDFKNAVNKSIPKDNIIKKIIKRFLYKLRTTIKR